jgi:hypothetical protein
MFTELVAHSYPQQLQVPVTMMSLLQAVLPKPPLHGLYHALCQTICLGMIPRSSAVINHGLLTQRLKLTKKFPSLIREYLCRSSKATQDTFQK